MQTTPDIAATDLFGREARHGTDPTVSVLLRLVSFWAVFSMESNGSGPIGATRTINVGMHAEPVCPTKEAAIDRYQPEWSVEQKRATQGRQLEIWRGDRATIDRQAAVDVGRH